MWVVSGLVLSLGLALVACWRRAARTGGHYERDIYGMDAAAHSRYALAFSGFTTLFIAALFLPGFPVTPLLAVLAFVAIFYGATFLRGASGEDE